jgi:hypothetical protein
MNKLNNKIIAQQKIAFIAKTRKKKDNKIRNHNICYFEQWNRCQI